MSASPDRTSPDRTSPDRTTIAPMTPSAADDLREQLFAHTRRLQAVWSLGGREVELVVGFETGELVTSTAWARP
jgi:hypothetical protein